MMELFLRIVLGVACVAGGSMVLLGVSEVVFPEKDRLQDFLIYVGLGSGLLLATFSIVIAGKIAIFGL